MMTNSPHAGRTQAPSHWPVVGAGMAASLVGIGLARFAYTPLLPAMAERGWFQASAAAYLGAANLAGYLLGAIGGRWLTRLASPGRILQAMMLLASLSFAACAFPLSQAWFFVWRLLSGIAGGAIMVLVSSTVLPRVPARQKGMASGAIFLGIGAGVVVSATLVPLVLQVGLRETWLAMAVLSLALTCASWPVWPVEPGHGHTAMAQGSRVGRPDAAMRKLLAQYALMAFGLVPEMLFLVDYAARSLHMGSAAGAQVWTAYGIGAAAGPLLYGMAAHRFGAQTTIRIALAVQVVAVGALLASTATAAVLLWALVIGSFPSGAVPAALARVHEHFDGHHERQRMWSLATISFALMQAISGYVYSSIYELTHGQHVVLFGIGIVAYVAALGLDALPRMRLAWRRDVAHCARP